MKRSIRSLAIGASLLAQSVAASAGDFSAFAVPTRIDTTAYAGFMVYGSFGNPAGCTNANMFFIKEAHPQFKQIYALVLMAITARQPIAMYAHSCEPVGWYAGPSVTFNAVTTGNVVLQP